MEIKQIMQLGLSEENAKKVFEQITNYIEKQVQERVRKLNLEYQNQVQEIKIKFMIEKELILNGARNLKAVFALIDKENLKIENDEIPSLKSKIQKLKNDPETSFLFYKDKQLNTFENNYLTGITPFESNFSNENRVRDMNYEQLCNYYEQYVQF